MPTKTTEKDVQEWICRNFSPVPKIIIERAYCRRFLWNRFKKVVGQGNKLSNVTDIVYLIHSHRLAEDLLDLEKELTTLGFQLFKTSDQVYFLQLTEYNLDALQNNWTPLYESVLSLDTVPDKKDEVKEPVHRTTEVFDYDKEMKPATRKRRTTKPKATTTT